MEIDYIREFLILAETGNYLEAADKLFISQSTLTRHIQSVEKDLGVQLFDRTTRKVALNQFGSSFLPYAKELSRIQYEYTTAFYNALNGVSGTVTVGSVPVMAQYNITGLLARFRQQNPSFTIHVMEEDSLRLTELLRSGQCDFAFLRDNDDSDNEFNTFLFAQDNLTAILPEHHPLAQCNSVRLEQLSEEPMLLIGKDTFMYSLCVNECHKAGFEPSVIFTGHRAENIIDLVSKQMGVSLLMRKPAAYLAKSGISIVDIEPRITTTINLAYRKTTKMSIAATHFLNLAKAI